MCARWRRCWRKARGTTTARRPRAAGSALAKATRGRSGSRHCWVDMSRASYMEAQRHLLPDGRWHFQHGPIDIVIGADGDALALKLAHEAAWQRFRSVLHELVAELPTLRRPVMGPCPLQGAIARRMWWACRPFHADFITPMAAVAG